MVLLLKRELDSLPECLRWRWSGWPPLLVTMWVILDFRIWVIFLQGEKKFLERKFTPLSASNFCGRVTVNVFLLIHRLSDNYIGGAEGPVYLTSSLI